MDENQAHRHIEKQAMDLRKSRYDVASLILKTYQM
jgi:response regulator NasT